MLYEDKRLKLNWNSKTVSYKHFDDLGNYVIRMEDADFGRFNEIAPILDAMGDPFRPCCTAASKRNKDGEVIIGRNMDVEISQNPAYITRVSGGKYDTIAFTYSGIGGKYSYDRLKEEDEDLDYLSTIPYKATDAMNEKGLYIEANMREMDGDFNFYCSGTNPGKMRACILSAPTLVALNCATVAEAWDYLQNAYDWYTVGLPVYGSKDHPALWNLALIIGDANGDYGLFEFGFNKVYYTPYPSGQGNYYIHPNLAEYAINGTGYGRYAAALKNLPGCETEWDMLENMKPAMWKNEILNPGGLGYSDFQMNVNTRRSMSQEELHKGFEAKMAPLQPLAKEYYEGNEKPLRDNASVWTTSFNFGVNCHKKHLILRLWEKDTVILEYQW